MTASIDGDGDKFGGGGCCCSKHVFAENVKLRNVAPENSFAFELFQTKDVRSKMEIEIKDSAIRPSILNRLPILPIYFHRIDVTT